MSVVYAAAGRKITCNGPWEGFSFLREGEVMYIRQADMHPELRAILEERDPALGPQAAGTNYIFELERLRGCWRVVDLLRAHGVEAIILDCDGNIDELLPMSISST